MTVIHLKYAASFLRYALPLQGNKWHGIQGDADLTNML